MCDPCSLVSLLKEVGNSGITTLAINVSYPIQIHGPAFGLCGLLTARDDPLDGAIQIRAKVDWSKQRFSRNESQLCRDIFQDLNTI